MMRSRPNRKPRSSSLELATVMSSEGWVVRASGALDHATAHHLEESIEHIAGPNRQIVLDISGLATFDGAGLDSIIRAGQHAESMGATLRIRGRLGSSRSLPPPPEPPA